MRSLRNPPSGNANDKQQLPERIWIDPQDSTFWNDTGDVKSLIPYTRIHPVDDARVREIRRLQTWRREHADKFKVNALHAACADIDYLLSLIPQLSSGEPRLKDGGAENCAYCDSSLGCAEHGDDDELQRLRREFDLSGLGDRPSSMGVEKLRRLIELERGEGKP
jgi:hypothetical protein